MLLVRAGQLNPKQSRGKQRSVRAVMVLFFVVRVLLYLVRLALILLNVHCVVERSRSM